MRNISDARKDTAIKILKDELDITPIEVTRFPTGYCHSVYHVKTIDGELVLRITENALERYYLGSVKWLTKLAQLDIPAPVILKHGQYSDVYFALMSYMPGKDLGEIYHTLNENQKRGIVKCLSAIQRKVAELPSTGRYGYQDAMCESFTTWLEYIESGIERSSRQIKQNGIFSADICDSVTAIMHKFKEYFLSVPSKAFLDDITTKNVLINEGKLTGIVDIDEMCYGDPVLTLGLTNMALLAIKADTNYIDYWLDEMSASQAQRKVLEFYTLYFCIDFMSAQGIKWDNGNHTVHNQEIVDILTAIYHKLLKKLS